jgi:hypothetical protein
MFTVEAGKQKKAISFGPPVLDDVSMAFNLSSKPMMSSGSGSGNGSSQGKWFNQKRAARSAVGANSEEGSSMNMMQIQQESRITPQPRRERKATATSAAKLAVLDDPFARI